MTKGFWKDCEKLSMSKVLLPRNYDKRLLKRLWEIEHEQSFIAQKLWQKAFEKIVKIEHEQSFISQKLWQKAFEKIVRNWAWANVPFPSNDEKIKKWHFPCNVILCVCTYFWTSGWGNCSIQGKVSTTQVCRAIYQSYSISAPD